MTAIISLLVLCALIILNGFFTMSETALIACRRARLQPSADDGDGVAKKILRMMDNPTAALSTIRHHDHRPRVRYDRRDGARRPDQHGA